MKEYDTIKFFKEVLLPEHKDVYVKLTLGDPPYFTKKFVHALINDLHLKFLEVNYQKDQLTASDLLIYEILKKSSDLERYLKFKE